MTLLGLGLGLHRVEPAVVPTPEEEDAQPPAPAAERELRAPSPFEAARVLRIERPLALLEEQGVPRLIAVVQRRALDGSPQRALLALDPTVAWEHMLGAEALVACGEDTAAVWERGYIRFVNLATGSFTVGRRTSPRCTAARTRDADTVVLECEGGALTIGLRDGTTTQEAATAPAPAARVEAVDVAGERWLHGPMLGASGRWTALVPWAQFQPTERRVAAGEFSLVLAEARGDALAVRYDFGRGHWAPMGAAPSVLELVRVLEGPSTTLVLADEGPRAVLVALGGAGSQAQWATSVAPGQGRTGPAMARGLVASVRHVAVVLEDGRSFVVLDGATGRASVNPFGVQVR